jgi:peptidoglycan hydrolase-like protein with peptidoglycan-binding domain
MKVVKLTERDLSRIVSRVLSEQLQVSDNTQPTTSSQTDGVPNIFQSQTGNRPEDIEFVNSLLKRQGAVKNSQGKINFPCLDKLNQYRTNKGGVYIVGNTTYKFFGNGEYRSWSTDTSKNQTKGTWSCNSKGNIELNGLESDLGVQKEKTPFQWKQAPTAEEVQSGKKLLRYGMMGDFVGVVQEKLKSLGSNPGTIDKKFGGNTLKAVKDFQKKSDLEDDGLVGKKTYAALFEVKPQAQPEQPNVATAEKTNVQSKQANTKTSPLRGQVQRSVSEPPTAASQTNTTVADTGLDFS